MVAAFPAYATTPACPPAGLQLDTQNAAQIITILPGCLGDPTDVGVALAEIARIVIDAHQQANPNRSYAAVEEVLVESFVSEILEPSVPAPAN